MAYLHSMRNPVIHGDFKTSDVLIEAHSYNAKITNFGLWDFKNFFIHHDQIGEFE